MNTMKTAMLMAALTALFMVAGQAMGGQQGMTMALLLALGLNFFAYWNSDKMALAMNGAREVSEAEAPDLHDLVASLAARAGLPKPRVYVVENETPNAFATGRNPEHAAVAVTTGIMRVLDRSELEGVIAHELGHIKNRDILIGSIAAVMAGSISYLANFAMFFGGGRSDEEGGGGNPILAILVLILAPVAAMLIQFAISRTREFGADRGGAEISGDPRALADALAKIDAHARGIPFPAAEAHPATAQMMIGNPRSGGGIKGLFSTHPATEERIARLLAMS
jgi:heat shock protein HtpX